MNEENRCPQCGAALPTNAPQGLCPGCLLKRGLDTHTEASRANSRVDSQNAAAPQSDFTPPEPEELAEYFPDLEILELIGRGGMGVVYKARQKRLDRLVALKILSPRFSQDAAFAERFAREARAMAMLSHPHVVAVYDFGESDGLYYFLMEYVDGVNLRRLLDMGRLDSEEALAPEQALKIVPQICEALQYAHDHGVVHRDIKPENVLLDKEGRVKIADFGIAKLVGARGSGLGGGNSEPGAGDSGVSDDAIPESTVPSPEPLTAAGQIVGTPQYMAPEQIDNPLQVDHRADIYSLGVVFYQMLTGELPQGQFAPPSKKVEIDVRLDEVVLRAMEKEPQRRYQQASEMKTRVENIATEQAKQPLNTEAIAQELLSRDYVIDIGSCLHRGWALVKGDFWPITGITALVLLLFYATKPLLPVALVIGGPLYGGLCLFFLKSIRGERPRVDTAISSFRFTFESVFFNLFLTGLIVATLTIFGLICLILPGVYLIVVWSFAVTIAADKRLDCWPAMELSRKMISKHWWKMFGLGLVLTAINVAGLLVFGIGVFITAPITLAALMYAYEDIFGATDYSKSASVGDIDSVNSAGDKANAGVKGPLSFSKWLARKRRFWPPLVVRRGDRRIINWPAMAMQGLRWIFAIILVWLLVAVTHGGFVSMWDAPPACFIIAALILSCIMNLVIRLLRGFAIPLDQLPEFDTSNRGSRGQDTSVRISNGSSAVDSQATFSSTKHWRVFGVPLVGVRDGGKVIHWPGVCLYVAAMVFGGPLAVVVAYVSFCLAVSILRPGPNMGMGPSVLPVLYAEFLIISLLAVWGTAIAMLIVNIRQTLAGPIDGLARLDDWERSKTSSPTGNEMNSSLSAELMQSVYGRIKGPAIGLLVTGASNLVAIPAVFTAQAIAFHQKNMDFVHWQLFVPIFIIGVILSFLQILGALIMWRLRWYGLAIAASILAIIISPGNLIGLPIGIWALVVLSQRDVRTAFADARSAGVDGAPINGRPHGMIVALKYLIGGLVLLMATVWTVMSHDIAAIRFQAPLQNNLFRPDKVAAMAISLGLLSLGIGILFIRKKNAVWVILSVAVVCLLMLCGFLFVNLTNMTSTVRSLFDNELRVHQADRIDVAKHPGGPWIVQLPSGVTVELVGVGENKKEGNARWWRPDGSPLKDRPYKTLGGFVYGENVLAREFAVRLANLPSGQDGACWQIEPSGSSAGGHTPQSGPGDIRAIAVALPKTTRTANIRFGVASGPWQSITEGQGKSSMGFAAGIGVIFSQPFEKDGKVVISITHNIADDKETRIVAIGKDDQEYPSAVNVSGASNMKQLTGAFPDLSMKDIKTFRLESRPYKWVDFRNVSLQPAQKTDKPPEKPTEDMHAYLQKTQQLIRQRKYKEALERCIWFHDHALEHDPGMSGVRTSFALSDWKDLGEVYPPAKQAMVETRDRKTIAFEQGRGNPALFQDVAALNRTLGKTAATIQLFREIDKNDSELAKRCWHYVKDSLFEAKQYELIRKYIKDPLRQFERVKAIRHLTAVMSDDSRNDKPELKQWEENHFVEQCLNLIKLAQVNGDGDKAEDIRRRAAKVVDDPRLKIAAGPSLKDDKSERFGQVIERELESVVSGKSAIDLDSGKLYIGPQVVNTPNALFEWMTDSGVDALGMSSPAIRGLGGFDMIALVAENNRWNISIAELKAMLAMCKPGTTQMIGKGELPVTYLFKTREGGMGVLQITGFTEKPWAVKIRYKLVEKVLKGEKAVPTSDAPDKTERSKTGHSDSR